jgi:hypothetical protein
MGRFDTVYTPDQKDAFLSCVFDRETPFKRALQLAREGALTLDGDVIPAFEINEGTARNWIKRERAKRAGKGHSKLQDMRNADGVEVLRRRLIAWAEYQQDRMERRHAGPGGQPRNPERMWEEARLAARALKEIRALPDPDGPRTVASGAWNPEKKKPEGKAIGGMAGEILKAHRSNASASTAPDDMHNQRYTYTASEDAAQPARETQQTEEAETEAQLGSRASERLATLRGGGRTQGTYRMGS